MSSGERGKAQWIQQNINRKQKEMKTMTDLLNSYEENSLCFD